MRAIIERFVDRVFDDPMIGFLFCRADRERVKAKEYEFAASHLGAPVTYTGKPLRQAHSQHPILGGHFMRRLRILETTLDDFEAPPAVKAHWLRHTLELRPLITPDRTDECRGSPLGAGKLDSPSSTSDAPPGQHTVKLRRR